jgi:hypothetical protein
MSEQNFDKKSLYFIAIITILVLGHLYWEHLNGGIASHHLLNNADLPAISNWWGIAILPLLAWFATRRVKRRVSFQTDDAPEAGRIPKTVTLGFFGVLLLGLVQAISFEFGYESITMYTAGCVLLIGLFFPIYRTECILGYVLGSAFSFGPVIPMIGISVMAAISALSNLGLKPLLVNLLKTVSPMRQRQPNRAPPVRTKDE